MEATKRKQNYLGENTASKQILLTCQPYPVVKVFFGGNDSFREPLVIEAEQFIAVKGFKAKGKRITTWQIENIELLPPSPDAYESLDSADASSVSDASADSDSASAPSSAVPGSSASASPCVASKSAVTARLKNSLSSGKAAVAASISVACTYSGMPDMGVKAKSTRKSLSSLVFTVTFCA